MVLAAEGDTAAGHAFAPSARGRALRAWASAALLFGLFTLISRISQIIMRIEPRRAGKTMDSVAENAG